MLVFIAYMIIGAVLMYIVVDSKKLDNEMGGWYDEYEDSKHGYFERSTCDKTVKLMIAAWFLFAWPTILFMFLIKAFKEKK